MKPHPLLFLLIPLLVVLGSCTKEVSKEDSTHNSTNSGNFYATIDGKPWQGDSLQQAIVTAGIVTITGIGKTQEEMSIVLPALQTGVYAINSQSAGFALYTSLKEGVAELYLSNTSTDPSKAGGTVSLTTIDTVNKTLSGTFQFKLYQESNTTTKTVTEGVFKNIPYNTIDSIRPPIVPPGGNADTLIASIDSVVWNAAQVSGGTQSGMLIIAGASVDSQQTLGLYMPESISAGTYTLDFNTGIYIASYNPDPLTYMVSKGNGSLTIIENDTVNKRIKGSFNFVGISQTDNTSAKITNGYFSVGY